MSGSQKFIARNRAPRVQIEYDVELYGAEKKVQLPFVMGVMSDLAGKSEQPPVADRKFLEIDVDTFDERMRAMAPRASFTVPNTVTGEGNLSVDLTFEKMEDFSPQAIAARVESLAPLLEARRQLADLMAYMDGKSRAETLVENLLAAPELMQALAGGSSDPSDMDAALASLKARMPDPPPEDDSTDRTLSDLAARAPDDAPSGPSVDDVLGGIERRETAEAGDEAADVLAGIERRDVAEATDRSDDVLAGIERTAEPAEQDRTQDILADIERTEDASPEDGTADILAGIERREQTGETDSSADILAGIERAEDVEETDHAADALASIERREDTVEVDTTGEVLSSIERHEDVETPEGSEEVLAGIERRDDAPDADELSDVLADLAQEGDAAGASETEDLDALLADIGAGSEPETGDRTTDAADGDTDDLDALLADLGSDGPEASDPVEAEDVGGDGGADDLDALLADLDGEDGTEGMAAADDLDALLADLGADDVGISAQDQPEADASASTGNSDLDDLMADLGASEVGEDTAGDDLDALLDDLTSDDSTQESDEDDLDALLADMGTADLGSDSAEAPRAEHGVAIGAAPVQTPFGTITAPQPEREGMNRNRFRMALFGDFTGRSSRGLMETGDALAARKPILLDVDTVEDVIEGFATTLTLPIGRDGAGIEVKLGGLDDLHPDELYENVEIFEAISGLRQQLGVGSMAGKTTERLKAWAEEFGTPVTLPKRSAATSVPPDLKLSDFQALIGDTRGTLTNPTPADDLIARIVGPHVVKGPDAGAAEMLEAVDEALSAAMRLVLHHPDFQAVESQWRSLDLLARRIETDTELQIVLYDVSAEELAADLSAHEDLAQSGLYRLLTDVMDPEDGEGGFSALFGLYTFEETPPHAELLARIGLVAAHVDAPFFAAISPAYLETPKEERHKLVAQAWDKLRAQPQAAYLGLASPRFLLRQPYGAKSDPIYEFEFEEFTPKEGLKGLLWANPVVLVAILLAATYKKDGKAMNLGSVMSLGDIPFTFVTDRHGDQVALPCTERNLTSDPTQATLARGYMPVVWVKGRNEIRLGSFRSLGEAEIAGPWSVARPERPAPQTPTLEMDIAAAGATGAAAAGSATEDALADEGGLPDSGDSAEPGDVLDLLDSDDDDDQSLDDLLASFADDDEAAGDDDDMDPELAALLEGL